jgi:uncharacterized caspase-like protein
MPADPEPGPGAAPEGRRLALVVATTRYSGELRRLRSPGRDAEELGAVLADPTLGGFDVTTVLDRSSHDVRVAVEEFLADRRPADLVLVYVSCHGLLDARRRLYFAAPDTVKHRLAATGVEAQWLVELMEDCRARQQVLVLDCCFSGAFAHGAKGDDEDVDLGRRFTGHGRGRVVLTASRATEYSFEGDPVPGAAMPGSVFTAGLVEGIRSGAADLDGDGWVSVDDAYRYAFDHVRATDAQQTPQRWLYGAEGTILLAQTPSPGDPARRTPRILAALPGLPRIPARRPRRRVLTVASIALAAVAVAAVAVILAQTGGGNGDGDGDRGATQGLPFSRTVTVSSPWRLVIRDDLDKKPGQVDGGCLVTVVDTATGSKIIQTERVWGERTYQQHVSGTLRIDTELEGCTVFVREGAGDLRLPFVQSKTGDTEAFAAPERVVVQFGDRGNDPCTVTLHDATNGQELARATVRQNGPSVSMEPGGAERVYLAGIFCVLRVTAG